MESEDERVARLTAAEAEVLWLSFRASAIEDIARQIERSPAAVEQRFARARQKLGVRRTRDAAHMLARVESEKAVSFGVYAKADVADPVVEPPTPSSSESGWWRLLLPFPHEGRPWNDRSLRLRLVQIGIGFLILMLGLMLAANLGETLTRVMRTMR